MVDTLIYGGERNFGEIGISAARYIVEDVTILYSHFKDGWFVSFSTLCLYKKCKIVDTLI